MLFNLCAISRFFNYTLTVISQQWRKEIETLQAKIQSMKLLRGTHPSVLNARLRTSRLKIQLDDARVKLKQAEIEEKISNISSEWDTKMRARRSAVKNYDKVSGRGFINMAAIASHSAVTQEKLLKKEFHGMDSGEDYDAEPYTFRIPSACKPVGWGDIFKSIWISFHFKTFDFKGRCTSLFGSHPTERSLLGEST